MNTPMNVLYIVSDQHNAKCLGHLGHPEVKTPSLDRLAAGGMRFSAAITQNPICTPSRVSFLSGQYCHNHGYYGLSGQNPGGLPTVFGHFRRFGYTTGAIGKIHCPEYWVEDDCDVFHDTCGSSVGGRSEEYTAYLKERGLLEKEDHVRLHEFGDRGQQTVEGRASMVDYPDSQEGWGVRKSIEFMGQAKGRNVPFFLHVSLPKPHQCYAPAKRFWDLYEGVDLSLPPNAEYDMKKAEKAPHLIRMAEHWRQRDWQLFEPKTFEAGRMRKLRGYYGNISHIDYAVGELLDYLDASGLASNTIVVYTADHGDYAVEHGIMEKAPGICSDAITRVPMLWRIPGTTKPGTVCAELAELVDIVPTLCSAAGLPAMRTADGADLSGLLAGGTGPVRGIAVTENPWARSIRKGSFRMVYYPKDFFRSEYPDGFGELYDLDKDPWEMKNLYFEGAYREVRDSMEREFLDWLVSTTRPATVHPNAPEGALDWQTTRRYHHTVDQDGKVNSDQIRAAMARTENYI